ncbi:hypothetical protein BDP67DRAFT_265172 [Colletotrichum lupini]|nr:hypothetical protein BDP67DRAFT_265172 [Colletotrichum lupini]
MEAASRLALMAIVTRAGSPQQQLRQHLQQQRVPKQHQQQQRDEKAAWKHLHHPLVTVVENDVEAQAGLGAREEAAAAAAGEGKRMLGNLGHHHYHHQQRSSGRGRRGSAGSSSSRSSDGENGAMAARGGLEAVAWWILMGLELCVVGGVEGWIIYMVYNAGGDFAIWNWLSQFASPALMILLSVSLSAALLRGVGCLNRLGDLGFQAAGLVLATFCAVVVCAGVSGVEEGQGENGDRLEKKGVRVVVGLAVKMWFLFFIGFLCAVFQWYSEDQQRTTTSTTNQTPLLPKKGKKKERGYGTTTGGLATVDETVEGFVSDL